MEVFIQTFVAGILIGGIYALIGLGMTLIMGVMKIINLAHGQLMMVGMYITYTLFHFNLDPYFSLLVVMPSLFVIGALIQKYFLNPLLKIDSILPENQVLMTVGIGMVLTELMRFIFHSDYKSVQTGYSSAAFYLGDISFNLPMFIAFLIALLLTAALFLFLLKTDVGKSVRATAQNKEAAMLLGINAEWITVLTYGLGSCSGRGLRSPPAAHLLSVSRHRRPLHPEGVCHHHSGRHGKHGGRHRRRGGSGNSRIPGGHLSFPWRSRTPSPW